MAESQWGQARIEVIAQEAVILQKLLAGFSIRRIWLDLRSEGLVTVALSNFHAQVVSLRNRAEHARPGSATPGAANLRPALPLSSSSPQQPRPVSVSSSEGANPARLSSFAFDALAQPLDLRPPEDDGSTSREQDHAD